MNKTGLVAIIFAALIVVVGAVLVVMGDKAIGASTISAGIGLGAGTGVKAHKDTIIPQAPLADGAPVTAAELQR